MAQWQGLQQTVLLIALVLPFASARQNKTLHLQAHHLTAVAFLGQSSGDCECTFEDKCSCQGALKFMECVKAACKSESCQCEDTDGTNHYLKSCATMASACPDVGLTCTKEQATCDDKGDEPAKAPEKSEESTKSEKPEKAPEKSEESEKSEKPEKSDIDSEKYVLRTEYVATQKGLRSHSHRVFAQGIMTTLVVLSITVALASSSNALLSKNAWSTIDFVVVTFLAHAWFMVVTYGLSYFALSGLMKVIVHMIVSVVFLLVSIFGSWSLRNNEENVAIFNGVFTPMVVWCNAGFVETVHKNFKDSIPFVFLLLIVLSVWYALLAVGVYYVMARTTRRGWGDDVVQKLAGGALAGGFVLFTHLVISGTYQTIEDPHPNAPSFTQSMIMLFVSMLYVALAVICTPLIAKFKKSKESNYWVGRVCDVLGTMITMLPYWSIAMSFAHLIVDNMGYPPGDITARLVLCIVSTAVGIFMIAICAYVPYFNRQTEDAVQLSGILLGLGGFITGAAWSGLLVNAISMMVDGKDHVDTFPEKLGITAVLTAVVFPVYFLYIKPMVMQKTG